MANKLRQVFNKTDSLMNGQIYFKNQEAHEEFFKALKKVFQSGEAIHVGGIEKVSVSLNSGAHGFPINDEMGHILDFVVGPSLEKKEFPIEIDGERYILPLEYFYLIYNICFYYYLKKYCK